MPTTNYFNPDSYKPDQGYTPGMGLAGWLSSNEYDQAMRAKELQLSTVADALHKQQAETATYDLDAPVRAAERPEKISKSGLETLFNDTAAKDPQYTQARIGGEIGKNQSLEATGREALGTVDTKIATTNLQNVGKQIQTAGRQLEIAYRTNPMYGEAAYRDFIRKLDPKVQAAFPPTYDPQTAPKMIDQLAQVLMNTPEHRAEMEKEGLTQRESTRRTEITQGAETTRARETLAAARTPQQALNYASDQLHRRQKIDPAERKQLEDTIDTANDQMVEADLDRQFGKLDATSILLQRMQAFQRAKTLGMSDQDAQAQADNAIDDWHKMRDKRKVQLLKARGFTMSHLRRMNPKLSDAQIRESARVKRIKIVE